MKLIAIPAGPIGTNAWLLINEQNNEALLFDAPPESYTVIMKKIESSKCTIKGLLITHGHWDHMLDTHLFAADGVPVYAHKDGREFMENPEHMSDYAMPGLTWKGSKITNVVKDKDTLNLAGIDLEIRTAPGHCPGSIIIYIKDIHSAITGDVIFNGSIGRTDLPGGSFDVLQKHIREQVYTLPEQTIICPGHGDSTTVEKEKKTNPFVRKEE